MISITTLKRDSAHKSDWHAHEYGQLFLVHAGALAFGTQSGRWVMPVASAGWLPPQTQHVAESFDSIHVSVIYFESSERLPSEPLVFTPSALCQAVMGSLSDPDKSHPRKENLLTVLADELEHAQPEALFVPMPEDPSLHKIAQKILTQPDVDYDLDEWASMAHMSRRTLTRKFKQSTGFSLVQWQCRVKLLKACAMLSQGMSVTQVAFDLGFNQAGSLITLFKQHLGKTPGSFRTHRPI